MDREDDKELWDMLGRIPEPTFSPFFARDVVRNVRQRANRFEGVRNWFSWPRLTAAAAVAVVAIGMAIATLVPGWPQKFTEREPDVVAKIDPQDYDVVADLDELLAWDENRVWEDKPTL